MKPCYCGMRHSPSCPVFQGAKMEKIVDAKTVVVTKKTTTTSIKINPSSLLLLILDTVEKATGTRPLVSDIEFDSDMGLSDNVSVNIKIVKEETI